MAACIHRGRIASLVVLLSLAAANPRAKAQAGVDTQVDARPLPDIPALMHDVEANQKKAEAIEKNYIFHAVQTYQEMDSHSKVKKTSVEEVDVFWLYGMRERRLLKKDGRAITGDELAKENDRIDKAAAKARERRDRAETGGKETDSQGNQMLTVSRLLELGAFTNPRRVQLNGRDTIAVDYAGDPKAKTHTRFEEIIRDMVGTAWVDEQDRVLTQVQGHFVNTFKVGAGLVVDIRKDTGFFVQWKKINGEVWLPSRIDGKGSGHILLFFGMDGTLHIDYSDYRKFKATSTIIPGTTTVDPAAPDTNP